MASKKKTTALNRMMSHVGDEQKQVFNSAMFTPGFVTDTTNIRSQSNNYRYDLIPLETINFKSVSYEQWLYRSIAEDGAIQPIILTEEYEIEDKMGVKFKRGTGRYNIVDGNKRAYIYNLLLQEAREVNDGKKIDRFENIQALILPLDVEDEKVQAIKKVVDEDRQSGTAQVIKDITETINEDITYCYRYEMREVDVDKLIERDNKYSILDSEVDALEKSIYKLGLMQPIIVLPIINPRTGQIQYEIQAGHKRTRAIRQLIRHAEEDKYPKRQKEIILDKFKTVPALIIPMGASPADVEKIYNDTNILSRHMTSEDMLKHISYIENIPSRPRTKEEFIHFRDEGESMNSLSKKVQEELKKLGFNDWKSTKTAFFLNVYYYGSDKALEVFYEPTKYGMTQRDIYWIVTHYKDYHEREIQDEIINKTIEDKSYLEKLKDKKNTKRIKTLDIKEFSKGIKKEKVALEKLKIYPIEEMKSKEEVAEDIKIIKGMLASAKELVLELEEKIKQFESQA